MKRILIIMAAVVFATLFIPLIIVSMLSGTNAADKVSVYIKSEDAVREMEIDEYLKCVVAAEMPADFEGEALRAQAVAARTYLRTHMDDAKKGNIAEEHKGAAVCTESSHCQAYISEVDRKASWGDGAEEKWQKISDAVTDTTGQIITYAGKPISAVFHSTSSGHTEAAKDVWGGDVPYLQSVESKGDEYSPKYTSEVRLSEDEFRDIICSEVDEADPAGELYGNIVRSDAGGIISIDVCGATVAGTKLRSMLGLRSTNAEFNKTDGGVVISVKGNGHGVGMSQYGADYLASEGMGYEEILKTYYTGVELAKW